uniref:DNA-directed DNA polymerase n=1 Tax=Hypsizygus marmoreus TaxID=39966 RepID=A0A4P8D2S1_HYPMA|nr:hypothetical protein HM01MITGene24 [Hypsizygus marmoreus]QBZ73689.1 hypothetical protein HM01MITGene24 [Hypsizygus marmoreus]QCI56445.1 hypothetical protein [Hypsizygus marmoreus]QKJ80196.1 hypothetical protein [Hypsizygus marmoreus]
MEGYIHSNVSIASAVTSYAIIHMKPFILNPGTVYTDTDSIFTSTPLPSHLIDDDLGLMKDELKGSIVEEAYFIDIKKYGYWYYDQSQTIVEKSIISGISRDSVNFAEIKSVYNGNLITKEIPVRFNKSIKTLNININ